MSDSCSDGVDVGWVAVDDSIPSLINAELINSSRVSRRCDVNVCADSQVASVESSSPVPTDVLHGHQGCASDEVRSGADVDTRGVLDCQLVDGLYVSSSGHEMGLDMQSMQYRKCDHGVAMDRCYSRPGYSAQFKSKHVPEEWSILAVSLYLTGVSSTWGVRGLPRMIFDPGGICCYGFSFRTSGMSSLLQRSCTDRLCYNLRA